MISLVVVTIIVLYLFFPVFTCLRWNQR